ncbi:MULTISPECIES: ester cyclase [Cysteiniphilum]|uniref:ester cyclase n=1 Tax=Cysteiniphilum TaxID=2056696 RepID=UPI00177DAE34|nr:MULTISPECIES: ester cyclase [Cysteiniphilum]
MSKSNNKVNETKEFLDALLIGRDNNALGEFLTPDCLALTDYGIAFGRDEIAMDLSFYFQSIDVRSLDFLQQAHCADTTVLQFSENCEHIGEFCGIETTGKKFVFNASIMLRWQEDKIKEYSLSPDMAGVFAQITDGKTAAKTLEALNESNSRCYAMLAKLYVLINAQGLYLTKQQIKCLALYFEGYSTVVSARILQCSVGTVRTHIRNIQELYRSHFSGNIEAWFKSHGLFQNMRRYARLLR